MPSSGTFSLRLEKEKQPKRKKEKQRIASALRKCPHTRSQEKLKANGFCRRLAFGSSPEKLKFLFSCFILTACAASCVENKIDSVFFFSPFLLLRLPVGFMDEPSCTIASESFRWKVKPQPKTGSQIIATWIAGRGVKPTAVNVIVRSSNRAGARQVLA